MQILLATSALVVPGAAAMAAPALPSAGQFVAGHGAISKGSQALTITQSSPTGIINWQSFSIGAGNSVFFNNGAGSTLNRVTGGSLSQIDGLLRGTGSVYLINPQGIVVGPGGKVVTNGSFVASTRNISNQDFLSGNASFSGRSRGDVVNAGTITSKTGDAILVGRSVTNVGSISAPQGTAGLVAGNQMVLQPVGSDPRIAISGGTGSVTNAGTVKAAQAELSAAGGDVYALAENRGGLVTATGTRKIDGQVWLSAGGSVDVSGTIAAQNADGRGGRISVTADKSVALDGAKLSTVGAEGGGSIAVGGAKTGTVNVDSKTVLNASATDTGNGGDIVVKAQTTAFHGTARARGGAQGGNGGQIETSGHVLDVSRGHVDTSAPYGSTGDWLLDPYNVTISSATTASDSLSSGTYTPSANDSVINVSDLQTALASSNVTVTTGGSGSAGSQTGDITVASALSWSSGSKLTLDAYRSIHIDAPITVAGGGGVVLTTNDGGSGGDYDFGLTSTGFSGSLSFASGQSGQSLTINGTSYTLLYSLSDVQNINSGLAGNYALAGSLDGASTTGWVPLGTSASDTVQNSGHGFSGSFTGLGHTISNLVINTGTSNYGGLFGDATGTVRDIGMVGGSVSGGNAVGGLVGYQSGGTISDAYATGAVSGSNYVGGLVGYPNGGGTINDATATGAVSGSNFVGGLVGYKYGGTLSDVTATGAVSGSNYVGGLVGGGGGTLSDATATGAVSGSSQVGGLVGVLSAGTLSNVYATGAVSGSTDVGGLVGEQQGGTLTNTFWDTQTSGTTTGVGVKLYGTGTPTGLTTRQLQGLDPTPGGAYFSLSSNLGDSTGSTWGGGTGGLYPYLKTFFPTGVEALSGTVYKDAGVTPAASGSSGAVTVNLDGGGALLAQATTGANGYYYVALQAGAIANGSNLLVATPTNGSLSVKAATLAASTYSGATPIQAGVDLYGNYLSDQTGATTLSAAPSLSSFATAANTAAGTDTTATGIISGLSKPGYLTTGTSFTIDQSYTGSGLLVTTGSGDAITVSDPMTITSGGSLGLLSGGALKIDAPITAEGAVAVGLTYDSSSAGNLSFDLNSTGFLGALSFTKADGSAATSSVSGQSLTINGTSYTLLYSLDAVQNINTTGLSGNYALAGSLDGASTTGWVPLGTNGTGTVQNSGHGLSGNFTGLGHTISNLTINDGTNSYAGLFGYDTGTVRDLGMIGGSVSGGSLVGGLVGYGNGDTISDATASGAVSGSGEVGGLVGYQYGGTISDATATGAVSGSRNVGGLVGYQSGGTISDAAATGAVSGSTYVGGLMGEQGGTLSYATATGAVNGSTDVGGLVGYLGGTLSDATATGAVNGSTDVGGLVGYQSGGTLTNTSWDTQTSGTTTGVGNTSGTGTQGLTTRQLQGLDPISGTYFSLSSNLGDSTGSTWGGGAGGLFPYLKTFFPNGVEALSGTVYKDAGVTAAASGSSGAVTVNLDSDGALLGQATTGANGYYYVALPAGTIANGSNLLVATPTNGSLSVKAATLAASTYSGATPIQSGVDLYGNYLSDQTSATMLSAAPSLSTLQSDANTVAGTDTTATGIISGLSNPGYLTTGSSFTIDQSYTGSGLLVTTGSGDALTVAKSVTITSGGSLTLDSGGALNIDAPITAEGAVSVGLNYDSSSAGNQSFDLTSTGFLGSLSFTNANGTAATTSQSGSLAINGTSYTLLYSLTAVQNINSGLTGNYALASSLDGASTTGWVPLGTNGTGTAENSGQGFSGSFTGLGHTISNLTINDGTYSYAGLFGYDTGTVRDLGMIGGSVSGGDYVGGLVGYLNGTLSDATATGAVSGSGTYGGVYAGGLVGFQKGGTLSDATATGAVSGGSGVGGLVGYQYGTLSDATATGAVSGDASVGGLVGGQNGGTLSDATATGAVSGSGNYVGGLVGYQNSGTLSNATATGAVSGSNYVGGLVGFHRGTITNAYWDTQTSGTTTGVGQNAGGGTGSPTALTTRQLQGLDPISGTYFSLSSNLGDTGSTWGGGTGGLFPYLKTFFPTGVEALSGTAYSDAGVTQLASTSSAAVTVSVLGDGTALGSSTVGANGYYYIPVAPGSQQLVTYLNGAGVKANTYLVNSGSTSGSTVSADLYGGWLRMISNASTTSAMFSGLSTALGSNAGSDFLYASSALTNGANLEIQSTNTSGVTVDSSITSPAAVTLDAQGGITLASGVALTAGSNSNVVLAANGAFVNNAGSAAVAVSGTGRWLIYSSAPASDTFGNLNSNNTAIWNATYTSLAPGRVSQSGNRYLFSQQPTLTVTTTNLSKEYGVSGTSSVASAYTVSGYDAGVTGAFLGDNATSAYSGAPSVTSTGSAATASVTGGPYAITATAGTLASASGYAFTFSNTGQLTVTARPITVTANAASKVYGNGAPTYTYTVTGDGLANGDTLSSVSLGSSGDAVTANAGQYAITSSSAVFGTGSASNYAITYGTLSNGLTVTARPITVTAASQSMIYGNALPSLTYTVGGDGLVNGDTLSGALATTASSSSNVGSYGITQGTLAASSNYSLTQFTGANVSVTPRPITVAASGQSMIYGNALPTLTYTVGGDGLVNGDTLSGVLATTASASSNVGSYGITQGTLAASSNYSLTQFTGANVSVTARPITVTANNASRYMGLPNPALTYQITAGSLVNGDVLSGALATTASATSTVGTYAIIQGTLMATTNYALSFVPGTLTVQAPPPSQLFFTTLSGGASSSDGEGATYANPSQSDWFFSGSGGLGSSGGARQYQQGTPGQISSFIPITTSKPSKPTPHASVASLPSTTEFAMK